MIGFLYGSMKEKLSTRLDSYYAVKDLISAILGRTSLFCGLPRFLNKTKRHLSFRDLLMVCFLFCLFNLSTLDWRVLAVWESRSPLQPALPLCLFFFLGNVVFWYHDFMRSLKVLVEFFLLMKKLSYFCWHMPYALDSFLSKTLSYDLGSFLV